MEDPRKRVRIGPGANTAAVALTLAVYPTRV